MPQHISVIMPVYNEQQYISYAIESILNQTYPYFELIIIDDASTDHSLRISKQYAKKDKRIRILTHTTNKGNPAARNTGLKHAKYTTIAVQDADDIAHPQRFQIQIDYLNTHPQIFLVASGFRFIDSNNKTIGTYAYQLNHQQLAKKLLKTVAIHHTTVMYRDNTYQYREKFIATQDYDLWLRMLTDNKKMVVISNILNTYRLHPESVSHTIPRKQLEFKKIAINFFWQRTRYGADSYKQFNPQPIMNLPEHHRWNGQALIDARKIKFFFRNNEMDALRTAVNQFNMHNGVWMKGLVYKALSYFPHCVTTAINRYLWRETLDYVAIQQPPHTNHLKTNNTKYKNKKYLKKKHHQ